MKMKSIISFVFLLQVISNTVNLVTTQFPPDSVYKCRNTGTYTTRSDYARNLKVALNAVGMMKKVNGGFYNSSYGGNEAAYALALCSDVAHKWGGDCNDCVTKLSILVSIKCLDEKEAVIWDSNCMVRYSDRKSFGVLADWGWNLLPERGGAPDIAPFDNVVIKLATRLQGETAGGDNTKKAAPGTMTYPPYGVTIYGAMQCTPDLSKELCSKCLQSILLVHHPCCSGRTTVRMCSPNCFFSYRVQDFHHWKSHQALATSGTDYFTI
ncbi:hypothetical protein L1887_37481 [Cichorium endivia]|nr:hypothetical protein L1887_37481 [Cichorium endivia]